MYGTSADHGLTFAAGLAASSSCGEGDAVRLSDAAVWYLVQVKHRDRVGRPDIGSFEGVMTREDRTKGFFVAFDYSDNGLREIDAFFRKSGRAIVPLTVRDILDEVIAKKLA